MDREIRIEHKNGYSGKLVPGKEMTIYKNGAEVLHTFSPAARTMFDLHKCLADMPKLEAALYERREDD